MSPPAARLPALRLAVMTLICTACVTGAPSSPTRSPTPTWTRHVNARFGYSISLPPGWQLARTSLTPNLSSPVEILSIGTYRLRPGGPTCAQVPVSALQDLGRDDAFATIEESSGPHGFIPRPPHLESLAVARNAAAHLEIPYCLQNPNKAMSMWWIRFRDAGRSFYLLVAFGPRASEDTRDTTWAILDGIDFD